MELLAYRAKVTDHGADGLLITFPDVPEAIAQARSSDEVYGNAHDALAAALQGYLELGRPRPVGDVVEGLEGVLVSVAPAVGLALMLKEGMSRSGVSADLLAERLGCRVSTVGRMLRGQRHLTNLMVRALRTLGRPVALAL